MDRLRSAAVVRVGRAFASSSASMVSEEKVDGSNSRSAYRLQAPATSELPEGYVTAYRAQRHLALECCSIDCASRCSSHITRRSVPSRASIARGAKTPDLLATSRYRASRAGFARCRLAAAWYLVSTPTIPCLPSSRSSTNATSNAMRLPREAGWGTPGGG